MKGGGGRDKGRVKWGTHSQRSTATTTQLQHTHHTPVYSDTQSPIDKLTLTSCEQPRRCCSKKVSNPRARPALQIARGAQCVVKHSSNNTDRRQQAKSATHSWYVHTATVAHVMSCDNKSTHNPHTQSVTPLSPLPLTLCVTLNPTYLLAWSVRAFLSRIHTAASGNTPPGGLGEYVCWGQKQKGESEACV